ncbi:hypothetical protein [Helicobacter vulpis]|uniref:hypothetical protein n=1 Tax=Helicobacter vulpis TaxID=2316076 RepID=UPI000EB4816A|nr:hypothetical protein [Helicobacter vulpis]
MQESDVKLVELLKAKKSHFSQMIALMEESIWRYVLEVNPQKALRLRCKQAQYIRYEALFKECVQRLQEELGAREVK